jgi:transducin (beta)-like 1
MQDNGFPHSAFVFDTECAASSSNISGAQIPPGALVTLLQKSLIYLKSEKKIRDACRDQNSTISESVSEVCALFPAPVPDSATAEGLTAEELSPSNSKPLQTPNATPVSALSWSPDGQKVATLHSDGCGSIYLSNGSEHIPFGRPGAPLRRSLSWTPNSEFLAITADGETPILASSGDTRATIPVAASAVAFSPAEPVLALCATGDNSVGLWSIGGPAPSLLQRFDLHRAAVVSIVASRAGFATASLDRCVGFVGTNGPPSARVLRAHTLPVTAVAFAGTPLVSGGADGALFVWRNGLGGPY